MMEIIVEIVVIALMVDISFVLGVWTAQKTRKNETISVPTPADLMETHKEKLQERRAREEAVKEVERLEIILQNMERYDGTAAGQQDI